MRVDRDLLAKAGAAAAILAAAAGLSWGNWESHAAASYSHELVVAGRRHHAQTVAQDEIIEAQNRDIEMLLNQHTNLFNDIQADLHTVCTTFHIQCTT